MTLMARRKRALLRTTALMSGNRLLLRVLDRHLSSKGRPQASPDQPRAGGGETARPSARAR